MTVPTPDCYPWMDDALCRQVDCGDIFFPDQGESARPAKAACALCPVTAECLQYALANDERFGVWGGLSERERHKLKRGMPIKAAMKTVEMIDCGYCGKPFRKTSKIDVYCSNSCYRKEHQQRHSRAKLAIVRVCVTCGSEFSGVINGKYCSPACRKEQWKPIKAARHHEKVCRTCGAGFAGHHMARYCSEGCRRDGRNAHWRANHTQSQAAKKAL